MSPCSRLYRASRIRRYGWQEVQGPAPQGDPWQFEVRTFPSNTSTTSGLTHFTIEEWPGSKEGSSCARACSPGSVPRGSTSRRGQTHIGNAAAGIGTSGQVAGTFEPFEPPSVHGSAVWRKLSGEVTLDARFERLDSLEYLVPSAAAPASKAASGGQRSTQPSSAGSRKARSVLPFRTGRYACSRLKLQGDADLRVLVPRWNVASGPLEVSGSRLALSNVRSSGSDESRRWWGRFDVRSGTIGSTTSAGIDATTRDARPLLALFAADLPAWTRGLMDPSDFTATATVDMGPSETRVRGLDARGGSFHVQGHYVRRNANRTGAFLIESGILSLGLELDRDVTKIRLLGAKGWFEEQPDGGRIALDARTGPLGSLAEN